MPMLMVMLIRRRWIDRSQAALVLCDRAYLADMRHRVGTIELVAPIRATIALTHALDEPLCDGPGSESPNSCPCASLMPLNLSMSMNRTPNPPSHASGPGQQ
jgi:hypothetical protein